MRAVPDSLDPAVVRRVDARLDAVVRDERVAIPLAVESGSRAWGFPSPDSDYDCRFVYVRSQADYLDPWPRRDVVETPLDAVLDVNGWDLLKAVRLLVRGNATLLEWLRSPIVYRADAELRADLLALAGQVVDRDALRRHYLHVARGQRDRWWADREVPLKKVFYAVRPAATLRWLRARPDVAVPPMDLATLLVEGEVADDVVGAASDLVALKAVSREMGAGAVPVPLARFVSDELALASAAGEGHDGDRAAALAVAAASFRDLVARYAPPDAVPTPGPGAALRPAQAAVR
jgi:predicted nucleotidyltransferase